MRGLWLLLMLSLAFVGNAQEVPAFYKHRKQAWVDSVFQTLTPDDRIAQLFMVAAYSNRDTAHVNELARLIRSHHIGGLIFFQGGPVRQANMCNYLQAQSKVPLMVAMDAEWGIGMRLDSTIDYPRQMTLGAIQDNQLIYDFGKEVARQMKRMGMHINFAPVVDVNSNAANPVIGTRSFGEDMHDVAAKGIAYMKGMQDERILACAKHFPGHGDTDSDSHLTLPIINHNYHRLDSLELFPFRKMIDAGVGSIMVAHLYIPALDTTKNQASTLSGNIVTGLLKDSLGFEGIVVTDALNMKGVSQFYQPGEVDLRAFLAGNDLMEFAENVPLAIAKIRAAVDSGLVSQDEIDRRCTKILNAKAWFGLDRYRPINVKHITEDLNASRAKALDNELVSQSLTLLTNKNAVPLKGLDRKRIACLVIDGAEGNTFQRTLSHYAPIDNYRISVKDSAHLRYDLLNRLKTYSTVIVSIHGLTNSVPKNYGITQELMDILSELSFSTELIVNVFGNPYALGKITGLEFANAVLLSYERSETSESLAAQAIFGGISVSGRLPVTASQVFKRGVGLNTEKVRLGYGEPFEVGMEADELLRIDSIVNDAIKQKAMPGAQVLVAKDGVVVYDRCFGHHTYDRTVPVKWDDVYDLASITKVAASLPVFMQAVDERKVNVDDKVSDHLMRLKQTNKRDMTFRDMLAHYARLKAWIPFYQKTVSNGKPLDKYYSDSASAEFPFQVAENMFMRKDYPDTLYRLIDESELLETKQYKYSDLGYYYMKQTLEQLYRKPLDARASERFYRPLGLSTMGYHPLQTIVKERLVPTELDKGFRGQLIQGYVHDPGAAMMGGVGGHAGLFSNANDLAVLTQMYLNKGTYGGERYVQTKTIEEFTKCQFCKNGNRRGIGFDKPEPEGKGGPTCDCVSYLSFGHTGFTGTMVWADPDQQIVYVFLSNRVNPDAENNKLVKMDVRTKIQQVIYDSLKK